MSRQRPQRRHLWRSLYVWHRYLGLTAALFVLILSVTGLLLNHTEGLQLDSRSVSHSGVLDWYGIEAPNSVTSFMAGKQRVSQVGDRIFVNQQAIDGHYSELLGALVQDQILIVALSDRILLLTLSGELIETLDSLQGLPPGLQRIGRQRDGGIAALSRQGFYQVDRDFLRWTKISGEDNVSWSLPATIPPDLRVHLRQQYRQGILPWERVILDLHSGRLFGGWGIYVMDAAAIILILLALSGTLVWLRGRMRAQQRGKRRKD